MSPTIYKIIDSFCPVDKKLEIVTLIDLECSCEKLGINADWTDLMDRIHASLIKDTEWKVELINKNIYLAKTDWRDLLMFSGFAHDLTAHKKWLKLVIQKGII